MLYLQHKRGMGTGTGFMPFIRKYQPLISTDQIRSIESELKIAVSAANKFTHAKTVYVLRFDCFRVENMEYQHHGEEISPGLAIEKSLSGLTNVERTAIVIGSLVKLSKIFNLREGNWKIVLKAHADIDEED